jgi:hypothetical protein
LHCSLATPDRPPLQAFMHLHRCPASSARLGTPWL